MRMIFSVLALAASLDAAIAQQPPATNAQPPQPAFVNGALAVPGRWCINGCLEWQRAGLAPPAIVQDATAAYFADQDTLQQWLDECTEDGGPAAFTRSSELFASWKSWCEERNWQPGSAMALSEALIDRGFEKGRDGNGHRGFRRLAAKRR